MSRPRKQEVDYFPHYCDHGKVLFILESRFQNDGYAVFYKLTELLAKTEGHCYDCSITENWEFLLSKMLVSEVIVTDILNKLSEMKVIDTELWKEKRIWMQSFVDSISDVYSRRKVQLPSRPELMHTENPLNGISVNINPQSKVKESKVKESKYKKQKTPLPENFSISENVRKWANKKGHSCLEEHLEAFISKCKANGYHYLDWDAAFMEAIRSNWAKIGIDGGNNGNTSGYRKQGTSKPLPTGFEEDLRELQRKERAWLEKRKLSQNTASNQDSQNSG